MTIGKNIARLRKQKGWTQTELGNILGVSNQAVSKWESEMSMPDIMILPALADAFGCCIDELFSREVKTELRYAHHDEFPWPDDNTIRIFRTLGKKILETQDDSSYMEVAFPKNCNETTRQYFKVEVFGNLVSDGSINGDVVCHGRIDCHEINGDIQAQGDVSAYQINSHGKIVCREVKFKS